MQEGMASPTGSRNKSWPYKELFFSELSGNLSKSIGTLERSEAKAMLLLMCSQCQPLTEQEVLSVSGHQLEDMKALISPGSWDTLLCAVDPASLVDLTVSIIYKTFCSAGKKFSYLKFCSGSFSGPALEEPLPASHHAAESLTSAHPLSKSVPISATVSQPERNNVLV